MTKTAKLRSTPRAEDTRRKIYDAALQLFREQGFAQAAPIGRIEAGPARLTVQP